MRRSASGEIEEAEAWKGRVHERIKLVQKGYETLAIIVSTAPFRIIDGTPHF